MGRGCCIWVWSSTPAPGGHLPFPKCIVPRGCPARDTLLVQKRHLFQALRDWGLRSLAGIDSTPKPVAQRLQGQSGAVSWSKLEVSRAV